MDLTHMMFLAQEGGAPQGGGGFGDMSFFILMALMLVVFFFFMRRSTKRQEREHREMVESLEKGKRVMLSSGLIARVERIDKDEQEARLIIDEDKKVYAIYSLAAIAKVFEEKKSSPKKDD